MSPELLFGQNSSPTRESDIYALGMVIYEVSWYGYRCVPPFTRSQVLTGRRPFHCLAPCAVVIVVQKGKRPRKPVNAGLLGLSDRLWWLVVRCWDESPSTRPAAQDLLRYLQDASPTWVPPLEYPIPDDPDETGADFMSYGGWNTMVGALSSSLFAPLVVVLCVLALSLR